MMKLFPIFLFTVFFSLTVFAEDVLSLDEDDTDALLESLGEKPKSSSADSSVEDFILQSDDSVEQKIFLFQSMAEQHAKKEKYLDMIKTFLMVNKIPGISDIQKARNSARLGLRASNYSSRPQGGTDPVLAKASFDAYTDAFQYGKKAFLASKTSQELLDNGFALIGYSNDLNTPESIGEGLKTAERLLEIQTLGLSERFRILNGAISLCSKSGSYGHYEHLVISFQKRKLEFCKTPEEKARILFDIAWQQFFTMRDLSGARESVQTALESELPDGELKLSLTLLSNYLADSD